MNTLPPLPPELGRFDSIVDAHRAGDEVKLAESIGNNFAVIQGILREISKQQDKYRKQLQILEGYYKKI